MKCKNCGFENMDEANFCIQCGTRLEQEPEIAEAEYEEEKLLPISEEPAEPARLQEPEDPSYETVSDIIDALKEGNDQINAEAEKTQSALDQALNDLEEASMEVQEDPVKEDAAGKNENAEAVWYYMDGESPVGPFETKEIFEKIHDGVIDRNTWVWSRGLPDWIRLSQSPFQTQTNTCQSAKPEASFSASTGYSSSSSHAESSSPSTENSSVFGAMDSSAGSADSYSTQQSYNQSAGCNGAKTQSTTEWFCVQGNRSTGPYSPEVIKQMLLNKTIQPNTYVWKEGMDSWEYLRNTELASLIPVEPASRPAFQGGSNVNTGGYTSYGSTLTGNVKEKSIILYILLCLLTCGIWLFVWIYQIAKDVNELAAVQNKPRGCDPGLALILSIFTCDLYMIYFFYKDAAVLSQLDYPNYRVDNQSVLLAILGFFIPIAALAVIQDQINSIVRYGASSHYNQAY